MLYAVITKSGFYGAASEQIELTEPHITVEFDEEPAETLYAVLYKCGFPRLVTADYKKALVSFKELYDINYNKDSTLEPIKLINKIINVDI